MIRHCCFVRFQKISKITLKKGFWEFHRGGGPQKPKFLRETINQNWYFQRDREGVGQSKNPLPSSRGMDIFWNNTLTGCHTPNQEGKSR